MRFLCLHGTGTSSRIFEAQVSRITDQLEGHHDFVFLQGEVETDPAPGIFTHLPPRPYAFESIDTSQKTQLGSQHMIDYFPRYKEILSRSLLHVLRITNQVPDPSSVRTPRRIH